MNKVQLIKKMFKEILEAPKFDERKVQKFFSGHYVQKVDGNELDYLSFLAHIQKLKEKTLSQKVDIINVASNDDSVFTKHIVYSELKNGDSSIHKVFAEFTMQNNKIHECDELTLLIKGPKHSEYLGSDI